MGIADRMEAAANRVEKAGFSLAAYDFDQAARVIRAQTEALEDLSSAEAAYRLSHDLNGDGHIQTGRAWDAMRRAGDKARAAIKLAKESADA